MRDLVKPSDARGQDGRWRKLIWARREGDNIIPWELGIVFQPQYAEIQVDTYRAEYESAS